jgi:hypothetical protein
MRLDALMILFVVSVILVFGDLLASGSFKAIDRQPLIL